MAIINFFRWLRAHDAVTVAFVCGENGVVRRLRPKDGPNETLTGFYGDDIPLPVSFRRLHTNCWDAGDGKPVE